MECKLDGYSGGDSDVRQTLQKQLGMTTEQMDRVLGDIKRQWRLRGAGMARRVTGDLTQCSATKTNKLLVGLHMGVLTVLMIVLVVMAVTGGKVNWHYTALQVLALAGLVIAAARVRHSINLAAKVTWHGTNTDVRRMVVLGMVTAAVNWVLFVARGRARARFLVPVLLLLIGLTAYKVYTLTATFTDPGAGTSFAVMAALDRVLTSKRISAINNMVRGD